MKGLLEDTLLIIEQMFYNNEKITFYSVCEKAGVSRKFLYNHPEIIEKITFYRAFNSLEHKERLTQLNSQNQKMRELLNRYEEALIDSLKNEKS